MSIAAIPNRQWKFLIVDDEGTTQGTDDPAVAKEYALGSNVVIDMTTCQLVNVNYDPSNIPEQTLYKF